LIGRDQNFGQGVPERRFGAITAGTKMSARPRVRVVYYIQQDGGLSKPYARANSFAARISYEAERDGSVKQAVSGPKFDPPGS
jgi:hypothetical protein